MRSRHLPAMLVPALLALVSACSDQPAPPSVAGSSEDMPPKGTVQANDGVPIAYESLGEGKPAVLFVHCWACNREFWREQIDAVAAAGYRVVTLDLPGHGESGADRREWSVLGLADDVLAVANALELERFVLVGHSMGGPVSLATAARASGRVEGIACVDTLHNAEFEWPEGMTERIAASLEADYRAGMESFVPQMFKAEADPTIPQWVIDQAMASDHSATIALMRDFQSLDMPALFRDAGVPIRCINALSEKGQGMATETAVNQRYADFDVVLMEKVGHYPQLERPGEFNEKLLVVLAKLGHSGAPSFSVRTSSQAAH